MKHRIILLILALIIAVSGFGCGDKEKGAEIEKQNNKTETQAEQASSEISAAAVKVTDSAVNAEEAQSSPQSITVLSKSDSTITQAEKKKVLDDLSAEMDGLINEVNKDNSSESELE